MILTASLFLICIIVQQALGNYAAAAAYIAMIIIVIGRAVFEYKRLKRSMKDEK